MSLLTPAQLEAFVRDGAVTVSSAVPAAAIAAASAAMLEHAPQREGSARSGRTCDFFDPRLLAVIFDPWIEAAAKQALSAEAVTFFQTAIINAWPDPSADPSADRADLQQAEGGAGNQATRYHTDMQYNLSDLHATPRRMQVSFFLWVSDVPLGRANLHVRPGSHRQACEAWG